jgi:hypothetical protein
MEIVLLVLGIIGIAAAILDRTSQVWHFGSGFLFLVALTVVAFLLLQLERFTSYSPSFKPIAWAGGHFMVLGMPVVIVIYLATKALFLFTWPRE